MPLQRHPPASWGEGSTAWNRRLRLFAPPIERIGTAPGRASSQTRRHRAPLNQTYVENRRFEPQHSRPRVTHPGLICFAPSGLPINACRPHLVLRCSGEPQFLPAMERIPRVDWQPRRGEAKQRPAKSRGSLQTPRSPPTQGYPPWVGGDRSPPNSEAVVDDSNLEGATPVHLVDDIEDRAVRSTPSQ